jgi:hypothetical protein
MKTRKIVVAIPLLACLSASLLVPIALAQTTKTGTAKVEVQKEPITVDEVSFVGDTDKLATILKTIDTEYPTPHWKLNRNEQSPVCYVKQSRMKVNAVFKVPAGATGNRWVQGTAPGGYVFTKQNATAIQNRQLSVEGLEVAATQLLPDAVDLINPLTITWKTSATGQDGPWVEAGTSETLVYIVYGAPVDYHAKPNDTSKPLHEHLRYLLGPKIQIGGTEKGAWANGKATLNSSDNTSIPRAVQVGLRDDKRFTDRQCMSPWVVLTDGGVCESMADCAKAGLLVLGVSEDCLDRKSVVGLPTTQPATWLGGTSNKKVTTRFRARNGNEGEEWANEGVCGVDTDDQLWRYYDVSCTDAVGDGGWNTPGDASDNNLWFTGANAPVIAALVETYAEWTPGTNDPWEVATGDRITPQQIAVDPITCFQNKATVQFKTEGAKDIGVKVVLTLYHRQLINGQWVWVEVASKSVAIEKKWGNSQTVGFDNILAQGWYRCTAKIAKADGSTPHLVWSAEREFNNP